MPTYQLISSKNGQNVFPVWRNKANLLKIVQKISILQLLEKNDQICPNGIDPMQLQNIYECSTVISYFVQMVRGIGEVVVNAFNRTRFLIYRKPPNIT
jgi:hypothetical protein